MTPEECVARYGVIENGVWANESQWCHRIALPTPITLRVVNTLTGRPWTSAYCNRDMEQPLLAALVNILNRGVLGELQTFDGLFCIRDIRGEPGHFSAHSYAMAIDLNAQRNPLGGPCSWSSDFIRCFTDEGFTCGNDFKSRKDPQHFSLTGF